MTRSTEGRSDGPEGVGGWMILPILGMIVTIGFTLWNLSRIAQDFGNVVAILSSDSVAPPLKVAVATSLAGAVFIVLTAIRALIAIFNRSPAAPRAAMIHFAVLILAVSAEFWADVTISDAMNVAPDATTRETLRTIFYAPIWIAYFAMSKRVRNTFRPNAA